MQRVAGSISAAEKERYRAIARANAAVKSREAKQRDRLTTDPVSDRRYDDAEFEFLMAIAAYQKRTGVKFPTYCELLAILRELGYRKHE